MSNTHEQQLLHLVDRARRGVALPAELDQLATGITQQAVRMAEQRTATVEALDASQVTLRRHRRRIEKVEAHAAELEQLREALMRAHVALASQAGKDQAAIERVRALATRWDNALAPDKRYARAIRDALDQPQQPTTTEASCPGCGCKAHAGFCDSCGCLDSRERGEQVAEQQP